VGVRTIAALYDIHGNLPALDAVLADASALGVTEVVLGGDVVPGPMPREALDRLLSLELPAQFIMGNTDRETLIRAHGGTSTAVPPQFEAPIKWSADQLDRAHTSAMESWPATLRVSIHGIGDVLFCHASPRNDVDVFTKETPEEMLLPIIEAARTAVVVCGHTHMQFDRMIGTTRVVNAGSVGMPFGAPGAFWLLIGERIELRKTTYDLAGAAAAIRATRYPAAEEFARVNVLSPPSEATMLQAYGKARL
jgi:predicted phosphodiesterase